MTLVVSGGLPPDPSVVARLPNATRVIAADHGYDHALALGIRVDVLVGDLDSVDPLAASSAPSAGVDVRRYPRDKAATDLELALDLATEHDGIRVIVISGAGTDRLDHLAAQFGLLAAPKYARCSVEAWIGGAHLVAVHAGKPAVVNGRRGDIVTLLPVAGPADGITTDGLRFALRDETLNPFNTRGVSNEFLGTEASVTLGRGTLLIILPDALGGA